MNPLKVYRIVRVGWVIGRIAPGGVTYEPGDVFPTQKAAVEALTARKRKAANA